MHNYWNNVLERRLSRRRALVATSATAGAAAFLAACGGGDDTTSGGSGGGSTGGGSGLLVPLKDETKDAKRGGIYKSALNAVPSFDPHLTGNHVTHVWLAYSQLLKIKPGNGTRSDGSVEGEIAESWEISPDHLTITMKLTDKAHFTPKAPLNGRAVTMDDVLFSWERYKTLSPRKTELAADANPAAPIQSLTATDNKTLVIKLNKPIATILSSLTGGAPGTYYIVPKEAENPSVLDLRGTIAGSGPWYLEEWVPSSRITFRKNPGFGQDPRQVPFMDGIDFADLNEYSTILSQFKTGAFHDTYNNFLPDDILTTKNENPVLEIQTPGIVTANVRAFWGQNDDSIFRDERLRQAMMYTWDRDLFIDVSYNTEKFKKAGLPVETLYDIALRDGSRLEGWYLDPSDKDFGDNAKYFHYNPDEAKKLISAAGFNGSVAYNVYFGTLSRHPASYGPMLDILIGMARDSGFWTPTQVELNYDTEWNSNFRNNRGKFAGMAFTYDTGESDPVNDLYSHYHSSGSRYYIGDQKMDGMLDQAMAEFDTAKRKQIALDVQKYESGKFFGPRIGGASGFRITWPALRNKNVWQDENQGRYLATNWLDQTKAPFV
jgi:peptide/nickel transport system substrate-binding protein